MDKLKLYFSLTKPGVLFGNAITAGAGFFLAARGNIDLRLFAWMFIGTTLVIASACVTNNVLDTDIDRLMERTKKRATAAGLIPSRHGFIFAVVLGLAGLCLLYFYTNLLVVLTGVIGWIVYVWFYGAWSKRRSVHGTLVGAISGAMPVLAGYVSVSNTIDSGAVVVFIALVAWQLPEFYSIGIYRLQEYKAAGVPILPVVKGVSRTKRDILVYTAIFVLASIVLTPLGYTGYIYLVIMAGFGLYWLWLGIKGLSIADSDAWARQMFRFSLIMILLFSGMISVGPLLP